MFESDVYSRILNLQDRICVIEDTLEINNGRSVYGKWIETESGNYRCSVCSEELSYFGNIVKYKYCPFCGDKKKRFVMFHKKDRVANKKECEVEE
jgi:rubredoxin